MDHLFQIAHRLPQLLPLHVDRGIVHDQFVLAAGKVVEDRLDMRLRALVAAEVIGQLVAERNDAEDFARAGQLAALARIEIFDDPAQFGQICADAFVLVHGPHRAIQETVGHAGRGHDFLAAHIGQLVDLLAELRRIRILRNQVFDKPVDLGFQLALHLVRNRHQPGSLLRLDLGHRIGGRQVERGFGGSLRFRIAHGRRSLQAAMILY